MRETFGSGFMLKLVLVFIVIYVSFMAVAVNYAKSFRVKNNVINILEQYQYTGTNISAETGTGNVKDKIDVYLEGVPYYIEQSVVYSSCNNEGGKLTARGVCVVPLGDANARYHKVISYISISFPFFGINMTIPISGETQIISK